MHILVTGGMGYVGSALLPRLVSHENVRVTVVDNCMTGYSRFEHDRVTYVDADVRDVRDWQSILRDVDSVAHLAAVVGDPACEVAPQLAWEINYLGTVRLAEACQHHGVGHFVFASTCSNYGLFHDEEADISSPLYPQSDYAASKIHSEHYLLVNENTRFMPTILRFSTLYGLAPRMRFDLAVNAMTASALTEDKITVFGGDQWRPFLHVRDAARAVEKALHSDPRSRASHVFNCGSKQENYRIIDVANLIQRHVPTAELVINGLDGDSRDYRVNFERTTRELGFSTRSTVQDGVAEICDAFDAGLFLDPSNAKYSVCKSFLGVVDGRTKAGVRRTDQDWMTLK